MTPKLAWILRLSTTLTTVLILAFVAQATMSSLLDRTDRELSTFVIQALSTEDGSAGDASQELWVEAIIRDGQLLRWDSVKRSGPWQVVDKKGFGLPPQLLYKDVSQPGFLTFQGRNFLATLQANRWSGIIRVERDGKEAQIIDSKAPEGQERQIIVEDPRVKPSVALYFGALVLFGGLAYSFGPIPMERQNTPWLIFFLIVIHILFWASQCIGTTNDSPGYVEFFRSFLEGQPAPFPPGYPVLLGLVGGLSGESLGRWIALTQHCMVILAGVWVYFLLRRIVPDELATIGGLLAGALPSSLIVPQSVMTEIPTLFALVGTLYFAVRSVETGGLLLAILTGFLTGWAGTMRAVPLAALIPSLCIVYLGAQAKKNFLLAGVTIAVTAGTVLLPILWLWQGSGHPALSTGVGFHLFNRVVTEQKQLDKEGPATRRLLTLLQEKDPGNVPFWELREQGRVPELSYTEADNLFRTVALEGIRKDPWGYFIYSFPLTWRVLLGDPFGWLPVWGDTISSYPRLENPPLLTFTASSLTQRQNLEKAHRVLWPILCWTAIAGTFLGLLLPQRNMVLALAWVPIGYLFASAVVETYNPRFNVAIAPFVAALAMVPIGLVLDWKTTKRHIASIREEIAPYLISVRNGERRLNMKTYLGYSILSGLIVCSFLLTVCNKKEDSTVGGTQKASVPIAPTASSETRANPETAPAPTWALKVYEANEATLASSIESQRREVLRVDIRKAGTQTPWHIQINQAPLKVQAGHRYSVSFQARADGTRNAFLGFARAHDPWTDLGLYRSIALSPEWHSFQEEFVATVDDDNARILFDLGGNGIPAEFADVTLSRIGQE